MSSTIVSHVSFFRRPKRRLKISSLPEQSRYAVLFFFFMSDTSIRPTT
ncbi:hypothetical protein HMPREF3156_00636 [Neisseria sp. HMSC06F02]|nr:hypothetical protein HMPREF3156_00636 [Neisseria sp. HMSC06F02]